MSYFTINDIEQIRGRHLARKAVREFGAEVLFNKDDAASIVSFKNEYDGGPGSGNFGHAGREGKVGGSAPSNESNSKASGVESVKSIASSIKKMESGETVEAHDNLYGVDSIFQKREEDGTWIDTSSGEIVYEKDLLDHKKYSNLKTGKQVHDEHVEKTLKPKFKTKEEYLKKKNEVYDATNNEAEWLEKEYKNVVSEIDSKYGNKYELRTSIINDASLSEDERDERLYELDEKFDRKKREITSIDSEFDDYRESILSKRMEIFEPEYEFRHIASDHSIDDDCKSDVINPI